MCALLKGLFIVGCLVHLAAGQDISVTLRKLRECFAKEGSMVCLKERALDALNETLMSDKSLNLYGIIDIVRDPEYKPEYDAEADLLPQDVQERSLKLNDMLYDKIEEFLGSRTIKIHLGNIVEGRGKKNKKQGGMLMMGGLAMAGMMAQLFMGKIAFMAGAALLLAKLALLLSTVIGFKKLSGGSSGGDVELRKSLLMLGGLAMAGIIIQKFVGFVGFFKVSSSIAFLKILFIAFMSYMTKKHKKFKLKDYI